MKTEKDILHENGNFWVSNEGTQYTVYRNGVTHAKADSSYAKTPDGLSIAKARCDYLAKIERDRQSNLAALVRADTARAIEADFDRER